MELEQVLRTCRFSKRYRGYYALETCIRIALEDEESLLYVTGIYMAAAHKQGISWTSLERNIRTVLSHSWEHGGQEPLERLSGGVLLEKPTVSELLEILVCYLKEQP